MFFCSENPQGRGEPVGCQLMGCAESDRISWLSRRKWQPAQCFRLENLWQRSLGGPRLWGQLQSWRSTEAICAAAAAAFHEREFHWIGAIVLTLVSGGAESSVALWAFCWVLGGSMYGLKWASFRSGIWALGCLGFSRRQVGPSGLQPAGLLQPSSAVGAQA